jgi:hypothetical protein
MAASPWSDKADHGLQTARCGLLFKPREWHEVVQRLARSASHAVVDKAKLLHRLRVEKIPAIEHKRSMHAF